MNAISVRLGAWLLAAVFAFAAGCGPSGPPRPKTYPVSGTVTYKGEPVADANLNFQLLTGSCSAFAKADAAGRYELMTFVQGDGAVPGDYLVSITKYEAPPPSGPSTINENYVPPGSNVPPAPPKNLLPKKYSQLKSSGLTAKVDEGSNTVDFKLAD